jgi:serine/threonine-protein kinase
MAMSPGTRLGPYEVIGPLGAGGMGEVYRATDTNLKRAVALKVLPAILLGDSSRVTRLQREAETLAALNHANVAHVYGLERSGATTAIVMELVEGPTLADRVAAGRLPPDEALGLALQILGGLEAAHESGIVHRDLKPANIKITTDGTVKVLDFGIAKVLDPRASAPAEVLTTPAATAAGIVLGTAAYMSPEQARGKSVDKRTDIWAFGCVLYEMLTGRAAFLGDDVTSTLARVLEREPDLKSLPAGVAPAVRRTVELCLQKDPKKRLRDVGDVRLALEGELGAPAGASAPLWRRALPAAATLVIGVLIAGAYFANQTAPAPAAVPAPALPVSRFVVTPPDTAPLANTGGRELAVSPDGQRFAYIAQDPRTGQLALHVRELNGLEARPLRGGEVEQQTANPLFSPDGKWLAFRSGQDIVRASVDGAPPIKIADVPAGAGFLSGHWLADDTIVFGSGLNLWRVSARGGGKAEPLVAGREIGAAAPVVLPGGRAVLFGRPNGDVEDATVLDLETGAQKVLVENAKNPVYSATGHLVFARDTTLMAVAFDAAELALTGEPAVLLQGVRFPGGNVAADFVLAENGTLVYVPDTGDGLAGAAVVWVDRQGKAAGRAIAEPVLGPRDPRVSPNGERLLLTTGGGTDLDVWSYDLKGRPPIRLAVTGINRRAVWSPDGREIAFLTNSGAGNSFANASVYTVPADGSVLAPRPLRAEAVAGAPQVWSAAGELLLVQFDSGGPRIAAISVAGTDPARDVIATEYVEFDAALSPNGRWLAYVSNRSGANEIWVQRYPDGVAERVSPSGGIEPRWSADGTELFYLQGNAMMAVAVEAANELSFAAPVQLFNSTYFVNPGPQTASYDVAPDGRFIMIDPGGGAGAGSRSSIVVVQNWAEELKRRVPAGR